MRLELLVLGEPIGVAHDDHWDGLQLVVLLELAADDVAVLSGGQVDREQDQVRALAADLLHAAFTVRGLSDTEPLEANAERIAPTRRVALDDQDFLGHGRGT